MSQNSEISLLVQIRDLIDDTFNLEELRDLCFRLGVKYDNLRGETLSARIRDLVQCMDRQRRLDDLLNFCARLRPEIEWPDLSAPVTLDTAPMTISAPKRNPHQIFLSHARQDADFSHRLAEDLRRHSWNVWIAPDSIQPGEKWVDAINRGLVESSIFLLVLTPDAINSTWVHSETSVAINFQHQEEIRFIPLDLKTAEVPPLWQAYQWIPFQNDYKSGLELLLQELQPEKMVQVVELYRQLQEAVARREWTLTQRLGAEITLTYPDYRETEQLIALTQSEEAREKSLQVEVAKLYERLRAAFDIADWEDVLVFTRQIEVLLPNYRDVTQLASYARRMQSQNRHDAFGQYLRFFPRWAWVGGVIIAILALISFFQLIDYGSDEITNATSTMTVLEISQIMLETSTATATLKPIWTATVSNMGELELAMTPTNEPTSTPTNEPTSTPTNESTSKPAYTPTITLTPVPDVDSIRVRSVDDVVMIYVPSGEFIMGNDDGEDDEQPSHVVYLDGYWLDQTEVTNAQFAEFVATTNYETIAEQKGGGHTFIGGEWGYVDGADWQHPFGSESDLIGKDDHPVVLVSWFDAIAYCEWVDARLPTEAEWEKAAGWDDDSQNYLTYPWGITFDGTRLNFCDSNCSLGWKDNSVDDGYQYTAPVGSYPDGASYFGALDMAGNVWEWTSSLYKPYPYAPDDGRESLNGTDDRVLRGGSWNFNDYGVRTTDREKYYPTTRSYSLGFRCAQ